MVQANLVRLCLALVVERAAALDHLILSHQTFIECVLGRAAQVRETLSDPQPESFPLDPHTTVYAAGRLGPPRALPGGAFCTLDCS